MEVGYIGALLGTCLGLIGAITGFAGSYARKEPEKYSRLFRSLLLADSIIGFALVAIGAVTRLLASSDYFKTIGELGWSSGSLMLGVIAGVSTEFLGKWCAQASIYTVLLSGVAFLAFGFKSLYAPTNPGDAIRQLSQAAILLIVYAVWLFLIKTNRISARDDFST